MPSRREKIEQMLAEEPGDVFLRYSLAMELDKAGEHDECLTLLRALAEGAPPYVPAFFMAGQILARLARVAEAQAALRAGIEAARSQGDQHAAAEMSELAASLESLGE